MSESGYHKVSEKMRVSFALGEVGDNVALNVFQFLVFTFYFTVVKLPVLWISLGFIIWSVWNGINDPLVGYLSDKTRSKRGRRVPWMMAATIPLSVIVFLLFTPPLVLNSDVINFIYMLVILILFDTTYTAFNLNYNALFSEMFVEMEDRSRTGKIRISCVMLATIFAFVFPTLIIDDITNKYNRPETLFQYQLTGLLAGIIIFVTYFIILKWGVREPEEFSQDAETAFTFKNTIKASFTNKSFLWFLLPTFGTWMVIGITAALVPLHATYAIGIEDSELIGLILLVLFLSSAASTPLWESIRRKKGARLAGMVGVTVWAMGSMLFAFSSSFEMALIFAIIDGIGLGGGLYFYDQCIAEIIDEDEITHGTRRSGIYYAVLNFIIKFSAIINFLIIGLVFSSVDWQTYTPNPGINTIFALRFLMGIFPLILLVISFIGLYFYPIHGERLMENRRKLTQLHDDKRSRTRVLK
ncbi:MAG: MFS transporter [Promethearchaeota archaeon]|nr:MAG: MFS transporter [Candidatus Lokiarchaeota archaeon]